MKTIRSFCIRLFLTSIIPAGCLWPASPLYNYQAVAKTGDKIGGVVLTGVGTPFMADNGSVLFVGDYNGVCCSALYSKDPGSGKQGSILAKEGDVIDGMTLLQISYPKKNDSGEVVFNATFTRGTTSGYGIFRPKAKVIAPGDVIDGLTIIAAFAFDLNDSGEVVFSANYSGPNGQSAGIFNEHHVLAKIGDAIGGVTLSSLGNPVVSKSGVIAFRGSYTEPPNVNVQAIFTQHRLVVKTGDKIGGITLNSLSDPTISELGLIGFRSLYADPAVSSGFGMGIFTERSVIAKTGDTIDGKVIDAWPIGVPLSLNLSFTASGDSVFEAVFRDANGIRTAGLFTNGLTVYTDGDSPAGLPTGNIAGFASVFSNNDSGQIAFAVLYKDPSTSKDAYAAVVATPKGSSSDIP